MNSSEATQLMQVDHVTVTTWWMQYIPIFMLYRTYLLRQYAI